MKYVLIVSHGILAKGIHSVLDMMAGKNRNDILSTSLIDGMSVSTFSEKLEELKQMMLMESKESIQELQLDTSVSDDEDI